MRPNKQSPDTDETPLNEKSTDGADALITNYIKDD